MTKKRIKAKPPVKKPEADEGYWAAEDELDVDKELRRFSRARDSETAQVYRFLSQCHSRLNREDEIALILKYQRGVGGVRREAYAEIVQAYARYAFCVAYRYRGLGLSPCDLLQEGMLALAKAANRFDVERGVRFTTYSGWWIRHEVQRAVRRTGRLVRIPLSHQEDALRVAHAVVRFNATFGCEPTEQELVLAVQCDGTLVGKRLTLQRLRQAQLVKPHLSLNAPADREGDDRGLKSRFIADFIRCDRASPEDHVRRDESCEMLLEALTALTPIQRLVVDQRFGLGGDGQEKTLEAIGHELHLTRERIRQIEAKAMEKLRHSLGLTRWKMRRRRCPHPNYPNST